MTDYKTKNYNMTEIYILISISNNHDKELEYLIKDLKQFGFQTLSEDFEVRRFF